MGDAPLDGAYLTISEHSCRRVRLGIVPWHAEHGSVSPAVAGGLKWESIVAGRDVEKTRTKLRYDPGGFTANPPWFVEEVKRE